MFTKLHGFGARLGEGFRREQWRKVGLALKEVLAQNHACGKELLYRIVEPDPPTKSP